MKNIKFYIEGLYKTDKRKETALAELENFLYFVKDCTCISMENTNNYGIKVTSETIENDVIIESSYIIFNKYDICVSHLFETTNRQIRYTVYL